MMIFLEGAHEVNIQDVPTLTLNPTDQLLHVCVHGAAWDEVPHVRWVADAMMILKVAKSEIDWSRFLLQAQKCRVTMPLRETFAYLRKKFGAPVSAEALKTLQNIPVSKREYRAYRYFTSPPTFLSVLVKFWLINSRLTGEVGFWKRLMQFSKKSALLEYATSLEGAVSYNFSRGTEIGANNVMVYKPIF